MDIFTHAAAGAATGLAFGRPLLGAVIGIAPDLVLGLRRKRTPTAAYNATHSVLFVLCATLTGVLTCSLAVGALIGFCLLSHIVLDVYTHSGTWGPPLLYPFLKVRFGCGEEWEFFNASWWFGLEVAAIWVISFLLISLLK